MLEPCAQFDAERAARYDHDIPLVVPGYGVLHALTAAMCVALLDGGGAPPAGPARVLLCGAGTGAELAALAAADRAWRFVAVDPSPEMLTHLRARASELGLHARVAVHAGEVASLPADAAPFDAATLLLVLHFLPDDGAKAALLGEVARRLRPGAPLLLADTAAGDLDLLLGALVARLRLAGTPAERAEALAAQVRGRLHLVDDARTAELLAGAGFCPPVRYWQGLAVCAWAARRLPGR